MFDYYQTDKEPLAQRDEPWFVAWGIRLLIASLIAASILFLGYVPFDPIYVKPWQHFAWFATVSASSVAWGILTLRLRSWDDDVWFYGLVKRMVKAALVVIAGQIVTIAALVLGLKLTGHG